jgi:hypothetical protein
MSFSGEHPRLGCLLWARALLDEGPVRITSASVGGALQSFGFDAFMH